MEEMKRNVYNSVKRPKDYTKMKTRKTYDNAVLKIPVKELKGNSIAKYVLSPHFNENKNCFMIKSQSKDPTGFEIYFD